MNWLRSNVVSCIGAFLTIIGLAFIGVSVYSYITTRSFLSRSQTTSGTVVDILMYTDDEGEELFKPKIQYLTSYEYIPSAGSRPSGYAIGDTVTILYDLNDPQQAKLLSFMDLWFMSMLFGILGGLMTLAGLAMIFSVQSQKQKRSWIAQHGTNIMADFVDVAESNVTVGEQAGKRILCQWLNPKDGKIYTFKSDAL